MVAPTPLASDRALGNAERARLSTVPRAVYDRHELALVVEKLARFAISPGNEFVEFLFGCQNRFWRS
jgi:hypothetical protein